RHKLPGIKQVKSPSCRMGFLRFCRPASVPVCLPGGAALTGATKPYPGQSAQHRLRRKLRHARSIISFQRKIKPRHGNPFAIIHFFPAPTLAMIAKTVLAKKNVNPITYKNITII
ncbi:hypothetical protein, partial [Klebsiella pneumoniae]|uniref:hypothetical protein n=1 Tax=Klebsiella pneumoniae TaxID=573 RepID=UPI00114D4810